MAILRYQYPVNNPRVSCEFGRKGTIWSVGWHIGTDYTASGNNYIYAIADGKITTAHTKDDNAYGKYIRITHPDGHISLYAHLNNLHDSKLNMEVKRGDIIGVMGTTGGVAKHLHIELHYGKWQYPKKGEDASWLQNPNEFIKDRIAYFKAIDDQKAKEEEEARKEAAKQYPSEYAELAWDWAKTYKITDGTWPGRNATRSDLIVYLSRYISYTDGVANILDINIVEHIERLMDLSITDGQLLDAYTIREQVIAMIFRYQTLNTPEFTLDIDTAIKWGVDNKLTDGLHMKDIATREQIITILYRLDSLGLPDPIIYPSKEFGEEEMEE